MALLALTAAMASALPAAAQRSYAQGEEVIVSGIVADEAGVALPGLEVVLSGHRESFDVWSWKQRQRGESSVTTVTDETGAFTLTWKWDRFYNRFRLSAGIRQMESGEETWWQVAESDQTRAMRRGSPVVADLLVASADEVRSLQNFIASLASDDTRRVYHEIGKPDKVQKVQLPSGLEVTWWYFERGMVYRFVDGRLDSSESFEPVQPVF